MPDFRKKPLSLHKKGKSMGQLAFIKMFLLVSIPTDVNDNRRHIHIFRKGKRHAGFSH